ncbi:HIT domain-containing protein [Candidatus Dependentiae bacterium]|nr:HIT domain-containing protein [Candidatus Dependentiae bacterium]
MDKLYAPWRDQYVMSHTKNDYSGACVFCTLFNKQESDEERYILYKDAMVAVILNLYPYNAGHLLVVPQNHVENLYELSDELLSRMIKISAVSTQIVKQALACQAINFGANFGRIAGAGIPEHVHLHIVPRYSGDTGFFTVIGDAKPISIDLNSVYKKMKPYFKEISL